MHEHLYLLKIHFHIYNNGIILLHIIYFLYNRNRHQQHYFEQLSIIS